MTTTYNSTIAETQTNLLALGFDPKGIDGKWGKNSQAALDNLMASTVDQSRKYGVTKVCWGSKFTIPELDRLALMVNRLGMAPVTINDFMACMAWETGEQFNPATKNPKSTATGLIQFMEATAGGLKTTTDALSKMTVLQQLEYVEKYFMAYKGKLANRGDVYMGILYPKGIGKEDSWVLWNDKDQAKTFAVNKGLDLNADGLITRQECLHKVNNKYVKGFLNGKFRAV